MSINKFLLHLSFEMRVIFTGNQVKFRKSNKLFIDTTTNMVFLYKRSTENHVCHILENFVNFHGSSNNIK